MNRLKAYDVPHKALRNALSQLSLASGNTDYANPEQVTRLHRLGKDIFHMLNVHAADENDITLTELEARCPGASDHDKADHERLEKIQDELEQLLDDIRSGCEAGKDMTAEGQEFYLAFSEFHGTYLKHAAEEERVTLPLLWEHFTDEELMAMRGKIIAKNAPEVMLNWLRFVSPAQTHGERVGLFFGLSKAAPPVFVEQAMGVVEQNLSAEEFRKLRDALSQVA